MEDFIEHLSTQATNNPGDLVTLIGFVVVCVLFAIAQIISH